jgi:N6-L-threonylcarbamoyladenine synthase
VGISFARTLSLVLRKPFISVDHVKAHLYANFLTFSRNGPKTPPRSSIAARRASLQEKKHQRGGPRLPAIGLVVSGGHTNLYHMKDLHHIRLIGATRDDAAGEAFDKVARICELGYPGGPAIDRLAQRSRKTQLTFTCAGLADTLDFSFSGIKTAVLYHHRDHRHEADFSIEEVARAFQDTVVSTLLSKCLMAVRRYKTKTLLVGGGVAANSQLREGLQQISKEHALDVYFPPMELCLDNAAMIAGLAYHLRRKTNG